MKKQRYDVRVLTYTTNDVKIAGYILVNVSYHVADWATHFLNDHHITSLMFTHNPLADVIRHNGKHITIGELVNKHYEINEKHF